MPGSHKNGLEEALARGGILQEFVPHGGVLYKLYCVGGRCKVVNRPSIPDNFASDGGAEQEDDPEGYARRVLGAEPLPSLLAERIAGAVAACAGGAELFGVDVVRRSGTNDVYVVDVNHFPGFHGMRTFPSALAALLSRVARISQPGRRGGVDGTDRAAVCSR
ncbi:inositol 1, 3, 4-trisphosphate 5/6-kinase-domain-containing protein [Baffinella frigidus]|nr:inositol 1, 3, 4-trisphosphate 5/6-kinase-domain-containing protein [Cryptophyta sp. CCMP2293]